MADIVTLGNGFCGSLSLFSSARYLVSLDQKHLWLVSHSLIPAPAKFAHFKFANFDRYAVTRRWALFYPLAGMFFDVFDGKVARWRNESSMLGQELDSLADSVSPVHLRSSLATHSTLSLDADLIRSRSRRSRILYRTAYPRRHPLSHLLHLRRNRPTRSIQRHRRSRPSRRQRKVKVHRRTAHSLFPRPRRSHGHLRSARDYRRSRWSGSRWINSRTAEIGSGGSLG